MGLETSVNFLGDLNRLWPLRTDQKRYGDNNIRNLKVALQQSLGGFAAGVWVTGTDGGAVNAYTVNPAVLPPSLGAKMTVVFSPVVTNTGACTLNYAGLGVKALKSVSGADLVAGDLVLGSIYAAFYNGTEYRLLSITKNYADQLAFSSALPALSLGFLRSDGAASAFTTTHTGYAQNEVKGADIASAATINLTTATGNLVHITGTTTITAITIPSGAERVVVFDGALTLTHNATTLILPTGSNILTAAGDIAVVRGDGSGNARVINYTRAAGQPLSATPYMRVTDQKAATTNGGTSLAADITQTRTLNTTEVNTITGASLASNEITLPAGRYRVRGRAPAYSVASHQAFLYNTSDSTYQLVGSSTYTGSASQNDSFFSGEFTLSASKNFKVRHFTQVAVASNGLGNTSGSGQTEIYTEVEIWKVA